MQINPNRNDPSDRHHPSPAALPYRYSNKVWATRIFIIGKRNEWDFNMWVRRREHYMQCTAVISYWHHNTSHCICNIYIFHQHSRVCRTCSSNVEKNYVHHTSHFSTHSTHTFLAFVRRTIMHSKKCILYTIYNCVIWGLCMGAMWLTMQRQCKMVNARHSSA